jgi:hypothetical protein
MNLPRRIGGDGSLEKTLKRVQRTSGIAYTQLKLGVNETGGELKWPKGRDLFA